jgi:nitronate monooxygenase
VHVLHRFDQLAMMSSMSLPEKLREGLAIPAIAAPMFLVSGPDLVVEACRAGVIGTFPALNQRTSEGYQEWLLEIQRRLDEARAETGRPAAQYGVNLIVHKTNERVERDLEITVRNRVPLVITSLGAAREVVDAVHSYGGLVFHDVIHLHHARKAADAGVDGIIAVAAGAGGHAGTLSPFALVAEIRAFFDKAVVLSGAITNGGQIAAAQLMGADFAYLGTRFISTRESLAPDGFKEMIVAASGKDILYTDAISGVHANFLRASIVAAGGDPENLPAHSGMRMTAEGEGKAWKNIWSAGHGVGDIHDIPTVAQLCGRLVREYGEAVRAVGRGMSFDSGRDTL